MKILFLGLSGYSYPHVRVRCYQFAEQLSKHGVDTEVLSFRDHMTPDLSEPEMYLLRDRKKLVLIAHSIWKMLKDHRRIPYIQKLHYHTAGVHLLNRLFKRPYILDYDDYEIGEDPFGVGLFAGFHHSSWNRLAYGAKDDKGILDRSARRALACIVSSHALLDLLKPLNPRTYLIETGVDTGRFTPGDRKHPILKGSNRFVYLWTGLVWGQTIAENLTFAVDALVLARKTCPGSVLRIIGSGPCFESVRQYARERLPEDAVEMTDWIDPDRMPDMLRQVDAGLLPMVRDIAWSRCKSPTKLFEYLAAGLPVIASPVGEVNHVIKMRENGLFANDLTQFSDAMIAIQQNKEMYTSLSESARRSAEANYSQAVLGDRLARILAALESSHRGSGHPAEASAGSSGTSPA